VGSLRPPTEREQPAVDKHIARRAAQTAPRVKVVAGKGVAAPNIRTDHPNQAVGTALLMEGLGTGDHDFFNGLVVQLANAGSRGKEIDEVGLNFMLSVVKGVNPKDQVETMLASHMAAGHMAIMTYARRFACVENIPQQDSTGRVFNQLMRTFAMQVEALKRYRTGGEQNITVQHISVSQGAQAIVGNVNQDARKSAPEMPAVPTPPSPEPKQSPVANIDEAGRAPIPFRRPHRK
jgi:hypothetical protein